MTLVGCCAIEMVGGIELIQSFSIHEIHEIHEMI